MKFNYFIVYYFINFVKFVICICLRKVISNNEMVENFYFLLFYLGLFCFILSYFVEESKIIKKVFFNKYWRKWGLLK